MLAQLFVLGLLATTGNVNVDAVFPQPGCDWGTPANSWSPKFPRTAPRGPRIDGGEDEINLSGITETGQVAVANDPIVATEILNYPVLEVE